MVPAGEWSLVCLFVCFVLELSVSSPYFFPVVKTACPFNVTFIAYLSSIQNQLRDLITVLHLNSSNSAKSK